MVVKTLKTKTGVPYRDLYTAFEWEGMQRANKCEIKEGEIYPFKTESFQVIENSDERVIVKRLKTNTLIEGVIKDLVETETKVETETEIKEEIKVEPKEEPKVENKVEPKTENKMETTNNLSIDETAAKLAKQLLQCVAQQNTNTAQNQDFKEIEDRMRKEIEDKMRKEIDDKVKQEIDKKIEEINDANTIKVKVNDLEVRKIDAKIIHKNFDDVMPLVKRARKVYLFGPAGTGKNVLAKQVADALNLPFYSSPSGMLFKSELEGHIDANGNYIETDFYRAVTSGGVFLLDEIDSTAAEVLVAFNTLLANGYYSFPKIGMVKAHKDFRVIAAGNTNGTGACAEYVARFLLDESTKDRFAFIRMVYDKRIERMMAKDDDLLLEFCYLLRKKISELNLPVIMSPRGIDEIKTDFQGYLEDNKSWTEELCRRKGLSSVTERWPEETLQFIQDNMPNLDNKYLKSFMQLPLPRE